MKEGEKPASPPSSSLSTTKNKSSLHEIKQKKKSDTIMCIEIVEEENTKQVDDGDAFGKSLALII